MKHALLVASAAVMILFGSVDLARSAPENDAVPSSVTPEAVTKVCMHWLAFAASQAGDWRGGSVPRIVGTREIFRGDTLLATCVRVEPRGYVLVAGHPDLPPIVAYSDACSLSVDPPGEACAYLCDRIATAIRVAEMIRRGTPPGGSADIEAKREIEANRATWEWLRMDRSEFDGERGGSSRIEGVGPLLTTAWAQSAPYNNLCPMGDGGRTLTGCVITAAAQIMRYHAWPPSGVGSHVEHWSGDHSCGGNVGGRDLGAAFSDTYDWSFMPGSCAGGCSPRQIAALAELNYELGVACNAEYGFCVTLADAPSLRAALATYFKYDDSMAAEMHSDYTAAEWFDMIRQEIDLRRPIYYEVPYHAIVVDGWRIANGQSQLHVNWGDGDQGGNTWWAVDHLPQSPDPSLEALTRGIVPHCNVRPDGTGDLPTIQDAMNAMPFGGVIELADGTYHGAGNVDLDPAGKGFTIRSISGNPSRCVIDCQGSPGSPHRAFHFHSAGDSVTVVESIMIRGGEAGDGGAIWCEGSGPTLRRVIFEANTADSRGAVIYASGPGRPVRVSRCTFYRNGAAAGTVFADAGAGILVDHSILSSGTAGGAAACAAGGSVTFVCSDLHGNAGGDWTGCIAGQAGIDGNLSADPLFCDASQDNFTLSVHSPCAAGNEPSCGTIGVETTSCGDGTTVVVRPDGTGDFLTIQQAADSVSAEGAVVLTAGTYKGDGNRDVDLHGKGITIRSETANAADVVIDCEGSLQTPHRGFTFESGEGLGTVLEQITIRDGIALEGGGAVRCDGASPTLSGCRFDSNISYGTAGGGAVYLANSSSRVDGCVFTNNIGYSCGGGAAISASAGCTISNCTFTKNIGGEGGGVSCSNGGTVIITNSAFNQNQAYGNGPGAGAAVNSATAQLSNCTFAGNFSLKGGGFASTSGTYTLTGCRFSANNSAIWGWFSEPSLIQSCTFDSNAATDNATATIRLTHEATPIENCTFYGNATPAGAIIVNAGSVPVRNTIFSWETQGSVVQCIYGGSVSLSCCDVYGNAGGLGCVAGQVGQNGNFAADPLFCDTGQGDFHLQPSSPCGPFTPPNTCDLIGAWTVGCATSRVESPVRPQVLSLFPPRPNPFFAMTAIHYTTSARDGDVRIAIYDVAGRLTRLLVDRSMGEGDHVVLWDGRDRSGKPVASGLYFIRVDGRSGSRTQRVMRIR